MPSYRTKGVVLKRRPLGEADRIITFFTEELGLCQGVAKGLRRTKSKMAGSLETFSNVDLQLYGKAGRDLLTVTGATTLDTFQVIRDDLYKTAYGALVLESVAELTPPREAHPAVYQALVAYCRVLEQTKRPIRLSYLFMLQVIAARGFTPLTETCCLCGREAGTGIMGWSARSGGIICSTCKKERPVGQTISEELWKAINSGLTTNVEELDKIPVGKKEQEQMIEIIESWLHMHIERPLRAEQFIESMKKFNAGMKKG